MKYLFWNTYKNKNINLVLRDLIVENHSSIIALAEYSANIDELIELLDDYGISMCPFPTMGCERIHILGDTELHVEPQIQTDHFSFQVIEKNTILCCVHLISQIYSDSEEKREIEIEQIVTDILDLEDKLHTKNTIIVGDFNTNPYDKECVSSRYLHGVPIYKESKKGYRTVQGQDFYMFYNPMWNFFGDFNEPYGTYYHNSGDTENTYWNVYDQVIIRPALREQFVNDSLKILTKTSKISLLDKHGHPNKEISDHLPITFEIMEDYHEQ